jgi:Helix-hairpin-helix domain
LIQVKAMLGDRCSLRGKEKHAGFAMPVVNAEIASQLDKVADLLDIEGANPFRVRAYRKAARLIGELPRSVADMLAHGEDLDELPGIGRDLADKITIIAHGEHLPMLDELEHDVSPGVTALLALPGLGPKRVPAARKAWHRHHRQAEKGERSRQAAQRCRDRPRHRSDGAPRDSRGCCHQSAYQIGDCRTDRCPAAS